MTQRCAASHLASLVLAQHRALLGHMGPWEAPTAESLELLPPSGVHRARWTLLCHCYAKAPKELSNRNGDPFLVHFHCQPDAT